MGSFYRETKADRRIRIGREIELEADERRCKEYKKFGKWIRTYDEVKQEILKERQNKIEKIKEEE